MTQPIDKETLESLLVWRRLDELCADAELACIDGRFDNEVLGAPGGDAGELLVVLSALEERADAQLSDAEVERIIEHQMERLGRFYLHSDRHALEQLEEALSEQPSMADALEEAGSIDALVRRPPADLQDRLAELLVLADHVGCGHLKLMLVHHDEYGVRKGLIESVIRGFYSLLWQGRDEPDFTVLEGVHTEEAILVFDTDEPLEPSVEVPAVRHSKSVPSLFVNHLPASRFKRTRTIDALAEVSDLVPDDEAERDALCERAAELAAHFGGVTVSHLAPDLPVFTIRFKDRTIESFA